MEKIITSANFSNERVDGLDKVTGKAKYTAEHSLPNLAYGIFICSTIAKGKIKKIETTEALNIPGAIEILHFENCPKIPGYQPSDFPELKNVSEWRGFKVLNDNLIRFYGQPIGLALADSTESANEMARQVKIEYEVEAFETDFDTLRKDASKLKGKNNYSRGKSQAYKEAPFFY